jgi:hypothetical protein
MFLSSKVDTLRDLYIARKGGKWDAHACDEAMTNLSSKIATLTWKDEIFLDCPGGGVPSISLVTAFLIASFDIFNRSRKGNESAAVWVSRRSSWRQVGTLKAVRETLLA